MSWSSGKDSAFALYELRKQHDLEVVALLTTINQAHQRVAMHAIRERLLERQALELGLPLVKVEIPAACPNSVYEEKISNALLRAADEGVTHIAFGDLFLEDIRAYREAMMASTPLKPLFPLWGRPTASLAEEMISTGQKALITCIDPKKLPVSFAGRQFDREFLAELPEDVDPCGENGEFHSFVYASPLFRHEIAVTVGDIIERDGYVFADLY